MLHEFLTANRADLIERCRLKVAERIAPKGIPAQLENGTPLFLDQLVKTLRIEQTSEPMKSRAVSGPSGGGAALSEMGETAAVHARDLFAHGFTVEEVIHNYGDLCQAITDSAFEHGTPLQVDEFRTLNRCLDNAIADAVTEYAYRRDLQMSDRGAQALNERLGRLAHELRNHIHIAMLAVKAIKEGNVGLSGATSGVLERSLRGLSTIIDRSLAEVRITAGMPARPERISLADLMAEVKITASLEAQSRQCGFSVSAVDPQLAVDADRDLLLSAISNLLQNAFKFTQRDSSVSLKTHASGDRILIDVEDRCGGLAPGDAERMFLPFTQRGADRSGLGLGLSICQRSVEANNGALSVRNIPGSGCVFTIDLPRRELVTEPRRYRR